MYKPNRKSILSNVLYLIMLSGLLQPAFAEDKTSPAYNQDTLVKEFFSIATGKPTLSSKELITKYPFSCNKKESFSDIRLKAGAQECWIDDIKTYPGIPLLILGLENDKIVAFVHHDETTEEPFTGEYHTECSDSDVRMSICYVKGATRKQKKYWLKLWDQRLRAAD